MHAKTLILDDGARLDRLAPHLEWGPSSRPDHLAQEAAHRAQSGRAAIDREAAARLEQRQGGDQASEAEQVVDMGVGEKHAIEAAQPEPALQQLALGALAAVHQEPPPPVQDDERGQPALDGGHARGGAKEHDLEHVRSPRADARAIMSARLRIRKPGIGRRPVGGSSSRGALFGPGAVLNSSRSRAALAERNHAQSARERARQRRPDDVPDRLYFDDILEAYEQQVEH